MILGNLCTRHCRFCAVRSGPPQPPLPDEPQNIAKIVKKLSLRYAVITSVTRDDLEDQGAAQFAATIQRVRALSPETKVEVLIPDLSWEKGNLQQVIAAGPDVMGHNMETVQRIFDKVRPEADYQRSLSVLRNVKKVSPSMIVKSGFMVGLGESRTEIKHLLQDLIHAGCDLLTIGQYLAPSRHAHVNETRFVRLEEFAAFKEMAMALGFFHVQSGPKVRSSFLAEEGYRHILAERKMPGVRGQNYCVT